MTEDVRPDLKTHFMSLFANLFLSVCTDLHISQQVQLGLCSCWLVCVISKPEALSQGVLQPDVTNTKGLSGIVLSSV